MLYTNYFANPSAKEHRKKEEERQDNKLSSITLAPNRESPRNSRV